MDMDACHRIFWGFDSFEGLPAAVEQDQNGTLLVGAKAEYRTGQDVYEGNLKALGAWDSRIRVVKGFFSVAIPTVSNKIKAIAFLRLDGDMYVSTKDVLDLLYDKVVVGGFIYVDECAFSHTSLRRRALADEPLQLRQLQRLPPRRGRV